LQRAVTRLDSVAGNSCGAASAPTGIGYDPCPSPCETISSNTYSGVGACLACLAQDRARDVAVSLFGTPAPPGTRTEETMCHAALVRATRRYMGKRMRT